MELCMRGPLSVGITTVALLVSACGSDGNLNATGTSDQALVVAADALLSAPVAIPPTSITTIGDTPGGLMPVANTDTALPGNVTDLFGETRLTWAFLDDEDVFEMSVRFGPESIEIINGLPIASSESDSFIGVIDSEELAFEQQFVSCAWLSDADVYFCVFGTDTPSDARFAFAPLFDQQSDGIVEFCEASLDCTADLFASADGAALLTVSDDEVAFRQAAPNASLLDPAPYLSYAKQGVATRATPSPLDVDLPGVAAAIDALREANRR